MTATASSPEKPVRHVTRSFVILAETVEQTYRPYIFFASSCWTNFFKNINIRTFSVEIV